MTTNLSATNLTAHDIRWTIDGHLVLDGVHLDLPAGSVGGLLGPNGSGKSSLLRIIAGVQRVTAPRGTVAGSVHWAGDDLLGMRPRARARRVAFVEQDSWTDVEMTVRQAVMLGRTPHRTRFAGEGLTDLTVVDHALDVVDLGPLADRIVTTLSGGERQRVHLARAIAQEPELLILDEPTNHLDIHAQLMMLELVRRLADTGTAVLIALHDLNLAAAYCDHVVLLADGQVVTAGTVDEVLVPGIIDPVYRVATTVFSHPVTGRPVLTYAPEGAPSWGSGARSGNPSAVAAAFQPSA